jgi:hypothetical protein
MLLRPAIVCCFRPADQHPTVPPAIALVGSADEIADAWIDFKRAGASQFILSGWPKRQSMKFFGEAVLPRVRIWKAAWQRHERIASGDARADGRR